MKLVSENTLPKRKRAPKHDLRKLIEDFANSEYQIAWLDFEEGEWGSVASCYCNVHRAVKQSKRPIKVIRRRDKVYLVKK